MKFREAERHVFGSDGSDTDRLGAELSFVTQRRKKWDSFYQEALNVLAPTMLTPVAVADRAEALANEAFGRWLPHDEATQKMGTEIFRALETAKSASRPRPGSGR